MQGAVISKRWIVMFTAVGLISLLGALYSPAWSGVHRGASAEGVCGDAPSTTPSMPDLLDHVVVLPDSVDVTAGQARTFEAFACSMNNDILTEDITVEWSVSPNVGAIASDGRYVAGAVTSNTAVDVKAHVVQTSTTASADGHATANVSPPPPPGATPTPIPPYTGPIPNPPSKPADIQSQTLVRPDLPTTASGTDSSGNKVVDVMVPAGAVTSPAFLQIGVLKDTDAAAVEALAKLPSTFLRVGNKIIKLEMVDANGVKVPPPFGVPITITVPFTDSEAAAVGGALNLRILKYDPNSKGWGTLSTLVDVGSKTLTGEVTSLSVYVIGKPGTVPTPTPKPVGTPTPGPKLPSTGGVAPSGSALAGLLAIGALLIGGGALIVRRRQHGKA